MKAALLQKIGQPPQILEVPTPEIGPDEVLVETHTCGICRTDLHLIDGLAYIPPLPHIPGHEPAGVVVQVGSRVRSVEVGQRVVPYLFLTCGCCYYCRSGQDAQCSDLGGILGVTCAGGFAEFFKAPASNMLPLPDDVPFDVGGLVSCAVITAVHAYRKAALGVGDTAVVLGAGGIGQILIQILSASGLRVAAISRSATSRRLAEQMGAGLTIALSDATMAEQIADYSGGQGAHCVFECVGTTETMKAACGCVMRGGRVIVIGEEPETPGVETIEIAQRELQIIGSRNGSRQDAVAALDMMQTGMINPPIAGHYPLDQLAEALELVRSGGAHGRVIVDIVN